MMSVKRRLSPIVRSNSVRMEARGQIGIMGAASARLLSADAAAWAALREQVIASEVGRLVQGIAALAVNNSSNCGVVGYHVKRIAPKGSFL
jgi:LDH2 family malate/lactate/ureidoglycolate dehydrogenase